MDKKRQRIVEQIAKELGTEIECISVDIDYESRLVYFKHVNVAYSARLTKTYRVKKNSIGFTIQQNRFEEKIMKVGDKIWTRGIEITITTEPYSLYGGMWQDGIDENGQTHTIPTQEQVKDNTKRDKAEWKSQQAAFSRLRKTL